jgi:cell shape-determining protein MreD
MSLFLQGKITVLGAPLNLTVLLAYFAGIRYGEARGLLLGGLIGALEDITALSILGPNLLSKGLIGFSSSFLISGTIFRWTPFFGIITVIALTLIDNAFVFISRSIFATLPAAAYNASLLALKQAVINAAAGIFIRPEDAD